MAELKKELQRKAEEEEREKAEKEKERKKKAEERTGFYNAVFKAIGDGQKNKKNFL